MLISKSRGMVAQLGALNSVNATHDEANGWTSLVPETRPGEPAEKSLVSPAMTFSRHPNRTSECLCLRVQGSDRTRHTVLEISKGYKGQCPYSRTL